MRDPAKIRAAIIGVFANPDMTQGQVFFKDGSMFMGEIAPAMRRQIYIWRGRCWLAATWFNIGTPVVGLALALLFAKAYVSSGSVLFFLSGCVAASWAAYFAFDLLRNGKRTIPKNY